MNQSATIGILAEYPMPVIYGGLEIVCERTYRALQKTKGFTVEYIEYHKPDQDFEVLSIFGNPPNMYEVAMHAAKTKKVVFSTVFGGAILSVPQSWAVKSFSWVIERFGQKVDHTRVREMFHAASHLAVLNDIEKAFIAERYGIAHEKMTIVPVGVEDHFFEATSELFLKKYGVKDFVLFTGNIIPRKNPLRLAQALKKLGLKGVFIGKEVPTDQEYAKEFAELIESTSDLLWIKGLPATDPLIPSAYKASAAFCLPSFAEGQSGSSLEAMATGKPLILADRPYSYQPCYSHIMRCKPESVEDIARAVSEVITNPDLYTSVLPEAHRYTAIALQMEKIYRDVLA